LIAAATPKERRAVFDSQASFDCWAALRAGGWDTSFWVIVSDSGDTWVVEATNAGREVRGQAASPEAAWETACREALGPAAETAFDVAGVGPADTTGRPRHAFILS
jgi:hypothetical protein